MQSARVRGCGSGYDLAMPIETPIPHAPSRTATAFDCPRCGTYAHQEFYVLQREYPDDQGGYWTTPAFDTSADPEFSPEPWTTTVPGTDQEVAVPESNAWAMSQCSRCNLFSTWRGARLMYPMSSSLAPKPNPDMPESATALYREASEVVGISRRAGAALARATLERVLKEVDPQDGRVDLATRIDRVLPKVSTPLGEMLTVIRHTGNKSVHPDDDPDDEVMLLILDPAQDDIVELIFASINDLVDELVTKPKRTADLFTRVPEKVRREVGKKTPPAAE